MSSRHPLPLVPFAMLLALLAGATWLATERLALPWAVVGDSMEPTLSDGDRVLVDLWSFRLRAPRRGEIVLFDGPSPGRTTLLKRVALAPPGSGRRFQTVLWDDANGADRLWVLGDNGASSADSRIFGPVPASRVRGKAVLRYWPLSRAGPIR